MLRRLDRVPAVSAAGPLPPLTGFCRSVPGPAEWLIAGVGQSEDEEAAAAGRRGAGLGTGRLGGGPIDLFRASWGGLADDWLLRLAGTE